MGRKTFISYKYSEAQKLRDDIIESLGKDGTYYQGETSDTPDLTDTSTENIKKNLKDMIYDTSVTIIVISPQMKESKWIDWEIEYSLRESSREGRTSKTNGVVGVIMKYQGNFNWIVSVNNNDDGCKPRIIDDTLLYQIINNNRFNLYPPVYSCEHCKTVNKLNGSYFSLCVSI